VLSRRALPKEKGNDFPPTAAILAGSIHTDGVVMSGLSREASQESEEDIFASTFAAKSQGKVKISGGADPLEAANEENVVGLAATKIRGEGTKEKDESLTCMELFNPRISLEFYALNYNTSYYNICNSIPLSLKIAMKRRRTPRRRRITWKCPTTTM